MKGSGLDVKNAIVIMEAVAHIIITRKLHIAEQNAEVKVQFLNSISF